MKRLLLFGIISTFLLSLGGCFSRSDLTAISSKNVNLSNMSIDRKNSKGRTTGKACTHTIIVFETAGLPVIDEAVDKALEAKNANVLLDAVAEWHKFYIPLLYGQTCWTVRGDAYDAY